MPINKSPYGHPMADASGRVPDTFATKTALKAAEADHEDRVPGRVVRLAADYSAWIWNATSVAADTSENLVLVPTDVSTSEAYLLDPTTAPGRWLRAPGSVDLSLPITFQTADAAVLFTVPIGARLLVQRGYWEVDTGFTGGTSSAIGLSSSATGHTTKGDLHGGASGDVAATLVAGITKGTVGADIASGVLLLPGETIRFDRITSAFTAGAGKAHLVCALVANAGV